MKILFHLGHPAHFHLFKNIINNLKKDNHDVAILIKKKDILEDLIKSSGFEYFNILPKGRKDSKFGIALGMVESDFKICRFSLSFKPDLLIGTSYAISHVGKLLNVPSLNVNEDDCDVVPLYSKFSYPWASVILSPKVCNNGEWNYKSIKYESYHELAYLHPNNFTPSIEIFKKYIYSDGAFFLLRFAKLNAHHDKGIKGIDDDFSVKIVKLLEPFGRVYITSERKLPGKLEPYRLNVNPLDIHHVIYFASLYIGDSQTMAAEAGVLGTPFVRFNDFVGRIGYLNELENKYHLGFGFRSEKKDEMLNKIAEMANTPDLKKIYQERKKEMLKDKIDLTAFFTWFIENYPQSERVMKESPDYQFKFV